MLGADVADGGLVDVAAATIDSGSSYAGIGFLQRLSGGDVDADGLADLLQGMPCSVNLLPVNPVEGLPYRRPAPAAVEDFRRHLLERGYSDEDFFDGVVITGSGAMHALIKEGAATMSF